MLSVAQQSRAHSPRVLPSTSEFLLTLPVGNQRLDQPGDEQKRTPQGKEILSQRARILNKEKHEARGVKEKQSYGPKPAPKKFVRAAKSTTPRSHRNPVQESAPRRIDHKAGGKGKRKRQ